MFVRKRLINFLQLGKKIKEEKDHYKLRINKNVLQLKCKCKQYKTNQVLLHTANSEICCWVQFYCI